MKLVYSSGKLGRNTLDLPHLRKRQRKSEMFSVAIILKENRGEETGGKRGLAE